MLQWCFHVERTVKLIESVRLGLCIIEQCVRAGVGGVEGGGGGEGGEYP